MAPSVTHMIWAQPIIVFLPPVTVLAQKCTCDPSWSNHSESQNFTKNYETKKLYVGAAGSHDPVGDDTKIIESTAENRWQENEFFV